MFGSLITVAGVIAVFWIVIFVVYLVVSRQQRSIADEIDDVERKLEEPEN